ncbi:monovalent cation/H(+) antiporter subunit G [Kaistia dalseonensis]|uniref:Multicomponent Na+:H+ antiporter subunit G n=1 Tax=Kaistia dalseonensis TaxID=410840 RepID=A0ABU0HET1_9HYPH|nr:monovalent cation/H(+) antiporter subunit G [Kaistia dalseonensis]MCX5497603.1 monovalent cation/H(+) antiporter subunit G [Kaistia dalseonensis]MDQ0440245.1 multicomponent Na+:H+ antiporter subunit G [Kaistia dalseonensis]
MIDLLRDIVAGLFLVAGAGFILVGAIGINRMPDLFTRIHAASLIDTTGVGLVLVGLMFLGGFSLVTVKLVFLLAFLLFMGPVATHALAAAALHAGIKPDLADAPKPPRGGKAANGKAANDRTANGKPAGAKAAGSRAAARKAGPL